jgi:nitrogen fixation/metabolism regulation signal transduction histidine kinase
MRNYDRGVGVRGEPKFTEVVREGTTTIVREVAALQRMVEEFSRFARLPEARPTAASLNDVVRDAVSLYDERLDGIRIDCSLSDDLPMLWLDTEQIKRVLVNLIDNAVEALAPDADGNGRKGEPTAVPERSIALETTHIRATDSARLVIADSGHGISPRDRDKLFLPKFSTRSRGTGLGLAIVSHIIADHKGRVWVEDNQPRGARFIIELPVARHE